MTIILNRKKNRYSYLIGVVAASFSNCVISHTTSLGYTVQGLSTVDIWFGSYHTGTNFNEGSLTLIGINGNSYPSTTVPFSLISQTLPTGLVSGVNYFGTTGSGGSQNATLIGFNQSYYAIQQNLPQTVFQGAEFTGLSAGAYQFTYQPLGQPSSNWSPINNSILTSQFSLGAGGSITVPGVSSPAQNIPDIDTQTSSYTAAQINNAQVNPRFTGGTLRLASNGIITTNFTITNANGIIDQNGTATTINGQFSDDSAGDRGKLIITNSDPGGGGKIVLGASNTNTGGYEVRAGATLEISNGSALGTGQLDLVGTATQSATLAVTATTTISNNITLKGDPTFDIASGTTTTVTGLISDGVAAGDLVKIGGGTLELTASNTYTGPTTINSGTLKISGTGSIANSTAVTNNATFDVTSATGNVTLAGTFTQGASGILKMNFSSDPSTNQRINVGSTASLSGTLNLTATAGGYRSGRYTLITSTGLGGTKFTTLSTNLSSLTNYNYQLAYDANNVFLDFLPTIADTLESLKQSASALRSIYNLQAAVVNNSLNYDCKIFAENGFCFSGGGRMALTNTITGDTTSSLLVGSYKLNEDVRIGGYIDQNVPTANITGITIEKSPMYGVFGVWNQNPDEMGYEVRISSGYSKQNITQTRNVIGTSEAGVGTSTLVTQAVSGVVSYAMPMTDSTWVASPYVGVRKTKINRGSYKESDSNSVFVPLTYSDLTQGITTALLGVRMSKKLDDDWLMMSNLGVERYTSSKTTDLIAIGLDGLTATDFNANYGKSRPVASLGVIYSVAKEQRLSFSAHYRKEAFQNSGNTVGLLLYQVGL